MDESTPSDAPDDEATPEAAAEPAACQPCRGTGRLNSNLGGTPHEVVCPWCEGSGQFIAEHDAQQAERGGERQGADPSAP